jgi:signal transduction histidine kinase
MHVRENSPSDQSRSQGGAKGSRLGLESDTPGGPILVDALWEDGVTRWATRMAEEIHKVGRGEAARRDRDTVRERLLRANRAVAVVIGTVMVLALAALWQGMRATRLEKEARGEQQRAERAEEGARMDLWRALVAEARATRLGQTLDRRSSALESIRRAAQLFPTPELRAEAVATLALPVRRLEASVAIDASVTAQELDASLRFCALGFTNGDVAIRRLSDGVELWRRTLVQAEVVPDQGHVVSLDFSPDAGLLSVRHNRGALAVWRVAGGERAYVRDADELRRPASRGLFSSDGQFLVAPVFSPDGFEVMEARTGRTVAHFPEVGSFHHAAVRPGHRQFAAYDGTKVRLIDWEKRRTLLELPVPYGALRMAWSPDGRQLAIFGNSLELKVWDVEERRARTLRGHQDSVYEGMFDPTGERLAALSHDGVTRIWSLNDGRVLDTAADRRLIRWGVEGRTGWLVPRRSVDVWQEEPAAGCQRLGTGDVAFDPMLMDVSPDGRWAMAVVPSEGLRVWRVGGAGSSRWVPLRGIRSACFDSMTNRVHIIRDGRVGWAEVALAAAGEADDFRLGAVTEEALDLPEVDRIACAAGSSRRVCTSLLLGRVFLLGAPDSGELSAVPGIVHSGMVFTGGSARGAGPTALSPDGRWLVCGADGPNGTCVYDTRTGERVQMLEGRMKGAQFSPDGQFLVLSGPPECRVLRTEDWKELWKRPLESSVYQYHGSAAFSPDGSRLGFLIGLRRVALVESATGKEMAILEGASGAPVLALRWAAGADGGVLAAATRDPSISVWHPDALQRELRELGLDWAEAVSAVPKVGAALVVAPVAAASVVWTSVGILMTAGGVAAISLLFLRRHRSLIEDYAETEARSMKREQELEIEREVSRLKSSFVAMVSHEFRTPLGITMSAVELLRHYHDRLPPAKRAELLEDIHSSTRHMSGLMEQVLLLGRVEAGKLGMRAAPMHLVGLIEKLADESLSASDRKCPVNLEVRGALEPAVGDEALVRHIVGNLISNAVKYSLAGSPVDVLVEREGTMAVVTVRDRGIGIPEAELPQLFQAFHRATNVGEIPGSGLGLVIVKRCVDLHGGTIAVQSVVGKGTEFRVRLPVFGQA